MGVIKEDMLKHVIALCSMGRASLGAAPGSM